METKEWSKSIHRAPRAPNSRNRALRGVWEKFLRDPKDSLGTWCEYPLCYGQSWKVFKQDSDTFTTVFEISVYGVGENRKPRWPEGQRVERWAFPLWPGRRSEGKERLSKEKSRTFSDSLGGKTEEERTKPTSRPLSDKWSRIKPGVFQRRGCKRNIKWEPFAWNYLRNFELAFINK